MCVIHLSFWGMYFIQRERGQEEWPVLAGVGIIVLEVCWGVWVWFSIASGTTMNDVII